MRIQRGIAAAGLLALGGCAVDSMPTPTPSPTPLVAPAAFLYVAAHDPSSVWVFALDGATGALVAVPGDPFAAGDHPASVATHPNGYAYVANAASDDISGFAIRSTGALGPLPSSPTSSGRGPVSLAVHPNGLFLYSANAGESPGTISAFSVDESTGALHPLDGSPYTVG